MAQQFGKTGLHTLLASVTQGSWQWGSATSQSVSLPILPDYSILHFWKTILANYSLSLDWLPSENLMQYGGSRPNEAAGDAGDVRLGVVSSEGTAAAEVYFETHTELRLDPFMLLRTLQFPQGSSWGKILLSRFRQASQEVWQAGCMLHELNKHGGASAGTNNIIQTWNSELREAFDILLLVGSHQRHWNKNTHGKVRNFLLLYAYFNLSLGRKCISPSLCRCN